MCLPLLALLPAAATAGGTAAAAGGTAVAAGAATAAATTAAMNFALTTMLLGSAVSVGSTIMQSNAQNKAISYNQQVAETNAKDAEQRGLIDESKVRMKTSLLQGEQRASAGASGALVDAGSFSDVNTQTQALGNQDALTTKYNADLEAKSYRTQSNLMGFQRQNTLLNASGSLLNSVSPLATKYVSTKWSKGTGEY